tara:strand:- start:535 stop:675 length:141 start_codon:yes stop_codon:yes gene_type:complete
MHRVLHQDIITIPGDRYLRLAYQQQPTSSANNQKISSSDFASHFSP